MRLRSITLANFKSFAGEAEIPIGRITSLVGPNGAGKSNALYGLEKIAAVLSGDEYLPEKADYFDDADGEEMRLGATLELSGSERGILLGRPAAKSAAIPHRNVVESALFRRLKYMALFRSRHGYRQELIALSDASGNPQIFVHADSRDSQPALGFRSIKKANLKKMTLPPLAYTMIEQQYGAAELFNMLDPSLFPALQGLFSGLSIVPAGRSVPTTVPVHQSDGLTLDGQNLPNEVHDLPRREQAAFDERMKSVTHGDPSGIEPRTVGSDLVLEVHDENLSRKTVHTDLGSGQLQTLILVWQMFRGPGTIFVVKEPELHLHAERQRQILRTIRDKSKEDGTQFVIETHSPVFLGAGPGERVILVTKDAGRSHVAEIAPDNVGLIRREMGITHADALSPANILFVEGCSDLVAFGSFLRIVAPDHALSTMVYTLGGAHNTKNLKMLIKYLEAEGRRMFVILDKNDRARRQVEELEGAGLLAGNYHFLAMNIEDEFDDDLVVKAACEVAAEAGGDLALTAAELRASKDGGAAVAAVLERRWNAEKYGPFNKVSLAKRIVSLAGGQVPPGIEASLREAVAHFEGGGSGGAGPVAGGRDAGPPAPEGTGSGADRTATAPPDRGRSP